jgi:signal transduction histidine kinase
MIAALASLTATTVALAEGYLGDPTGGWGLIELASLLMLVAIGVRFARARFGWIAVVAAAVAQVLWVTRYLPDKTFSTVVTGCLTSAVGAVAAAGVGVYPRMAATRLERSVANARAQQRRELERDLHDYVAHDLSGIIVQAQAARYAAKDDPSRMLEALRRIESAGRKAMTSMDRALELIRQDSAPGADAGTGFGQPCLDDLPALVDGYRRAGPGTVTSELPERFPAVPHVVSATIYRAAVEALTNVRRHAPDAPHVRVAVTAAAADADGGWIELVVANEVGPSAAARSVQRDRRGGTGLVGVAARVEALDGTLRAGPTADGWEVVVRLPIGDGDV